MILIDATPLRSSGHNECMPKHTEIWIDRGANPQLLDALRPGEPMHGVIEWRNFDVLHRDVQLRKRRQSSWSYVSLYVGLTAVLEIHACGDGLKFNAHGTHRDAGAFDDAWKRPMTTEAAQAEWPRISRYLDRATLAVAPRHITNEGLVHAALCSGQSDQYRVINREVSPNFTDTAARKAIEAEAKRRRLAQVRISWPPTIPIDSSSSKPSPRDPKRSSRLLSRSSSTPESSNGGSLKIQGQQLTRSTRCSISE